jgi:putative membrane protein
LQEQPPSEGGRRRSGGGDSSDVPVSDAGQRRLSPAAVFVWGVETIGRLGLGLIPLIAIGGVQRLLILGFVGFLLLSPIVRYMRFRYRITHEAFIVEGGLLFRWRRVVPLAHVQSVDTVQKLRHKAFGVVQLKVEAAGGSGTEADLVALDPEEAERIRGLLLGTERVPSRPDESKALHLARLSVRDLLLSGVTGGRVAVIAVMLGYAQEFIPENNVPSIVGGLDIENSATLWLVAGLATAFLIASIVISIIATVVVYWNFTLRLQDDRLIIERGLLDQRRASVPLRRVQAVTLNENLLRRALRLASLTVVVAGYAGPRQETEETSMLLPIAPRDTAFRVAGLVLGKDLGAPALLPAPRRALWPRLLRPALYALLAGVPLLIVRPALSLVGLVVLLIGLLLARSSWRSLGHDVSDGHVVARSGVWIRRTTIVPIKNIQELRLTRSPVQRIATLATVELRIPKAQPKAVDLDGGRADERFTELATLMQAQT